MPANSWEPRRLRDLVIAYSGGTPSRSCRTYWGGDIPWVTAKDLKTTEITSSEETLTSLGLENGSRLVPAGSILMLCRGMGLFKDLPIAITSRPMAFNQDLKALIPKPGVSARFLMSALAIRKQYLKRYVSRSGHGTGRLDFVSVSDLEIPLPGLDAQEEIVALLGDLERPVQLLERLILAKRKFRTGLQKALLSGQTRGPSFSGAWRPAFLGDLFVERTETGHENLPLLSITTDRGVIPRTEVDRKDSSSASKRQYKRITSGDIGYNTMRMWQGVSGLSSFEGIVSPAYTVCIPNSCIDGLFAGYLLKNPIVVNLFRRHSQGLVDDTLNLKFPHFARIAVTIPPVREQRWIGSVISSLDHEIVLLERYSEALRQRYNSLTQELLTGRLHYKEARLG